MNGRRRVPNVLLISLLVCALLAGVAPSAQAWEYTKRRGRPGRVLLNPVVVTDQTTLYGPVLTLSALGPKVRRKRGTRRAQDVVVTYRVQRWNGQRWRTVSAQRTWATIRRGRRAVRLPDMFVQPTSAVGYYRVRLRFTWFRSGTHKRIAVAKVRPNVRSDHVCGVDKRPCRAAPGWVRIGRHIMLGGGW